MTERNTAVPAVYLILKRDDEILLMQRAGSGYYDGWYSLPAGHVEYREAPVDALVRECEEEIGVTLSRKELKFAHLLYREAYDKTGDRTDMFFVSDDGHKYEPKNMEPDKCGDLSWFKLNELPKNMVQNVRFALEKALAGKLYSEMDYDTLDGFNDEYQKSFK